MRVVVTGSAGIVGSEVLNALDGPHDLRLIDHRPVPGHTALRADISKLPAAVDHHGWTNAFAGADVVVHLAEDPRPQADWQRVLHNNIVGTWNVLWTAAGHGVSRIVYASSHWAVHLLQPESGSKLVSDRKIGSGVAARPDTPYGAGKVAGETLGRMLVDIGKLQTFVAVRIGHYTPAAPDDARYRQYGISGTDIRELFRRCVEGEFAGYHVVYGASNVDATPFDLSNTCRLLDWEPAGLDIR